MFSQHTTAPFASPELAKWQPLPFLETQPCWQVGTMGHRMKNYGLAAGPRSTMQLFVSECKNPAYMQSQRKDHSASESSWGSTGTQFVQSSAVMLLCVCYKSQSLKTPKKKNSDGLREQQRKKQLLIWANTRQWRKEIKIGAKWEVK